MKIFTISRGSGRKPVEVESPRVKSRRGRSRVTAFVDGRSIWFESPDTVLRPSAEALGSALLVPALQTGRILSMEADVCRQWAGNMNRLADVFGALWYPEASRPLIVPVRDRSCDPRSDARLTALCFSGGVDAFYTLLASGKRVDVLISVIGYDIALRDYPRVAAMESILGSVAAETGCRPVRIFTNLRQHPLLKATPWLRAFGGPLASTGHLLDSLAGRILISSDGLGFEHPDVGSRSDVDYLHGSAALAVEHVAAGVTRFEKISAIAGHPVVQQHLRVCWQNVPRLVNCARCEKCIRTMLSLEACGLLDRYPGFNYGRGLESAIDGLPFVNGVVDSFFRDLRGRGLSRGVAEAVDRLLARSSARAPVTPSGSARSATVAGRKAPQRKRLLPVEAFEQVFAPLAGKEIGYVRAVGNVGDRLIEMAMIQLLAEYGIRWRRWRPDVAGDADGLDLLVFGGGGSMGSLYPVNYDIRSAALATGLPLIILPQSFTTREDRNFAKVFVRERASLAYREDGVLAPDLALGLAMPEPGPPSHDLGIYLRRDVERNRRWSPFLRDPAHLCRDPISYFALAARHRRMITDRLHFAIAGLHAGREVTLVANNYFKNQSMHETWLEKLGCRFAQDLAGAVHLNA